MRAKAWIAIGILLIAVGVGVAVLISMASEKAEQPIRTEEKKENQFDATVTAVEDGYLMVEADQGQRIVGEVKVMTGLLEKSTMESVKAGCRVRVTHDGKMTMSLPPQMSALELFLLNE